MLAILVVGNLVIPLLMLVGYAAGLFESADTSGTSSTVK